ncbi:hypothetical protein OG21DRAFT_1482245 [Imleria badia]|nr:hypothetical protein OG21DRAFT_1482245 [Imleria badia]
MPSYLYVLVSNLQGGVGKCHNSVTIKSLEYASLSSHYHGTLPVLLFEPSLRLVPPAEQKSASLTEKANSFGLHDTLRYGPRSIAAETKSRGDIEHRLSRWEETQDNLKLTMLRNVYGLHAPARLLMERKIVAANPHMPGMGRSNLHLDILMGRDETLDPADIFLGMEQGLPLNLHAEMEKKLRM